MTSRIKAIQAAFAALTMLALAPSAHAGGANKISVIVFPGGFNWPLWVGQEQGFFKKNGVEVEITPTPDSKFQLTGLIDGQFDIAMTAIDNVIAYSEGQGGAPTKQTPDIVAFMGADNGFLRLVSVPSVKTYADLKGKTVSVDAMTTGYAFVLRRLLEQAGVRPADIAFESVGGVMQRFSSLIEQKYAATLLISPFEVEAEAKGFNRIANAEDALGHYQGLVGAVRREWARSNEASLVGYIIGYRQSLDWLYARNNKAQAIALLRNKLPSLSADSAEKSYLALLDPNRGFTKDVQLDVEGIKTVLALRSSYGEPRRSLTDASKYIDQQYLDKAAKK